jgi:hypothetical protein
VDQARTYRDAAKSYHFPFSESSMELHEHCHFQNNYIAGSEQNYGVPSPNAFEPMSACRDEMMRTKERLPLEIGSTIRINGTLQTFSVLLDAASGFIRSGN